MVISGYIAHIDGLSAKVLGLHARQRRLENIPWVLCVGHSDFTLRTHGADGVRENLKRTA